MHIFGLFCFLKKLSHYVALNSLELTVNTNRPEICYIKHTRLAFNSEIHILVLELQACTIMTKLDILYFLFSLLAIIYAQRYCLKIKVLPLPNLS